MRKPRSNFMLAILFLILVFYICFYQMERNEISDIYIVRVLGIDKDKNGYTVTALYNTTGGSSSSSNSGSGGGGGSSMKALNGSGDSIYMAFENMKKKSPREMTIAHTSFYLLSESAASEGVEGCLDYIARDQSVKTNASVYVLQSENVSSFLMKSVDEEFLVNENLEDITANKANQLRKSENTLLNVLNNLKDDYSPLLIPYLIYKDNCLYTGGYAVFKEDTFYKYLDYDTSMTIDLLRKRLRSYPIYLNNGIGLEVTNYDVFITADLTDTAPVIQIKMNLYSNIKEISAEDKSLGNEKLDRLQKIQGEYIVNKIKNVIALSKEYQIDLLEIKRILANNKNADLDALASDWDSYFQSVIYDINVQTTISKNNVII